MNEYERALELKEETIANRRFLHENAETGLHLPETKAFVMKKLKEYGIEPVEWRGRNCYNRKRRKSYSASSRYGCASDERRKWRAIFE